MRKLISALLLFSLLSFPLLAVAQDAPPSLAEIAAADENFSILLEAVAAAGLSETLSSEGALTVFAPTNAAFETLPPGMLEGLLASPPSVEAVVKYHILEGVFTAEDLAATGTVPTLLGAPLSFSLEDDTLLINGTVQIVTSDIEASNGILHVIDAVLVPERPGSAPAEAADAESLAEVIAGQEDLAFLGTALGLSEVAAIGLSLPSDSPVTLFAPNDEAFTALDEETRNAAIADPKLLTSILLYHLLPQALPSADLIAALEQTDTLEVETLLPGAKVTLSLDEDGNVLVNEAVVVEVDLQASNGILHKINAVLVPPAEAILDQETYDALVEAAASAGGKPAGDDSSASAGNTEIPEGPALDPNWAAVAGGFGMAELDTADDFFVTVIDPFAEGEDAELYGIEIINWTAEYQYTGFLVEQFLPAEILLWMAEQDPTVWDNISITVLEKLPAEELAKLPAEVQARVQ